MSTIKNDTNGNLDPMSLEAIEQELAAFEAKVAEWAAQEEANRPKAKRAAALNVVRATAQKAE